MRLQHFIKIFASLSTSVILLMGLNACSTNRQAGAPVLSPPNGPASPSFASSAICADNPFLQKYQCSFNRVEQAARSGDPDAQYALGYLYYYGIGTTQDRQTGLVWIRKAAAQGQTVAQEALQNLTISPKSSSKTSGPKSFSATGSMSTPPATSDSKPKVTTTPQAAPEKPLSDYLPNYGEKRINATTTPPPSVNLSSPPETDNQ